MNVRTRVGDGVIRAAFAAMLLPAFVRAADSKPADIDPCAAPVRVHLSVSPSDEAAKQQWAVDSCGIRDLLSIDPPDAKAPIVALTAHPASLDVHVELPMGTARSIYDAKEVPLDAKLLIIKPAVAGPDLALSIEPLTDKPYVGLQVSNMPADQLLRELIRIKQLKVRHVERATATHVTFHFQFVPVKTVVQLIAEVAGNRAVQDATGNFDIVAIRNGAAIDKLRADLDADRKSVV